MIGIERSVAAWNLSQAEAAKRLHITRLNDLLRGRINKFTLDALTKLATHTGLTVKMSVNKDCGEAGGVRNMQFNALLPQLPLLQAYRLRPSAGWEKVAEGRMRALP
jgi:hypothetical protein